MVFYFIKRDILHLELFLKHVKKRVVVQSIVECHPTNLYCKLVKSSYQIK